MSTSDTEPCDPNTHISMQTTARRLTNDPNVSRPVRTFVSWTLLDPFAVTFRFQTGLTTFVEWFFARELLPEGGGIGDVVVAWEDDGVHLFLSSPSGNAELVLDSDWMDEVLAALDAALPFGTEPDVETWSDEEWQDALAVLHTPRKQPR